MQTIPSRVLLILRLLAGLMIGTGHPGGALAVAIAAGAGIWMARADSVRRDLR